MTSTHQVKPSANTQKDMIEENNNFSTLLLCAKNIASSVLIIVVNKAIMVSGFSFIMVLTSLHFVVTSLFVHLYRYWENQQKHNNSSGGPTYTLLTTNPKTEEEGINDEKHGESKFNHSFSLLESIQSFFAIPIAEVLLIAFLNTLSIVSMNMSLLTNSVGLYQISKMMCIPVVVIIDYIWYDKRYSTQIKVSLSVLLVGICIATVTDVQVNLLGSIIALIAVLSTAVSQIILSQSSKTHNISSLNMTASILPVQALLCLIGAIPTDMTLMLLKGTRFIDRSVFDYLIDSFSDTYVVTMIILSCLLSISTNYYGIALLGQTSPVTFQVVGHFKTCLILISGYLLFPDPKATIVDNLKNIFGVAIAVLGVVLYGHFKSTENK
jgi:hypothetical protein